MATSPFVNPLLEASTGADVPSLVTPLTPTAGIGSANLQSSMADLALTGERLVKASQFTMPKMRQPPAYIRPSTQEVFRRGVTFTADDAARALETENLPERETPPPPGAGWVPLGEEAYQQYIQSIRAPSLGRLASKSFGRGVDIQQQLGGQFLQFMGAEELGGRITAAQEEQLRKTAPFARQFTDIGEPNRGVLDWFVGNLAEQGPNFIISALTGVGGALVGGATVNASTRALASQFLKPSNSQSIMAAAKKYAADPKSLNPSEIKLLHEAAGITAGAQIKAIEGLKSGLIFDTLAEGARGGLAAAQLQRARTIGAAAGLGAQGYATGVADVYGSTMEAGDPDRVTAAALGIPYAALESLLEFGIAKRILGTAGATRPTIRSIKGAGAQAAEVGRRAGVGLAVGGGIEGGTEAAQEGILLGVEGVDWNSPEGVSRLVNSFAAGFGVGGPLGGIANIPGKATPTNLLEPGKTTEPLKATGEFPEGPYPPPPTPTGPRLPMVVAPGTQGDLFGGVGPVSPIPGVPSGAAPIPGVAGQYTPVTTGGIPRATEVPITQGDLFAPGPAQGNLFGAPGPATVYPVGVEAAPAAVPAPLPGQMALQFAPPAPAGIGFTERQPVPQTQIAQQLEAIRRQQEFDQAMAQRRETEIAQAEAQRQLQMVSPVSEPATAPKSAEQILRERLLSTFPPIRETGGRPKQVSPTEPQQLPLFGRRGLPRPSKAERLRRGVTPLPEKVGPTIPVTPRESLQVAGQLPLFTQEGRPSVAALKGAGKRQKVRPQLQKGGRQRPSEPAKKIRRVRETVAKRQRVDADTPDGGRFVGLVDNEGNLISGKYTYPDGSVFEGSFRDNAPYTGDFVDAKKAEFRLNKGEPTLTKEAPVKEAPPKEEPPPPTPKKTLKKEAPKREAPTPAPKAEAAPAAYASPDEAWEDMKPDEAPRLTDLSPVQQAEWIVLYETNRVSQASANEILKSRTKIVTGETGRVEQLTKKIREEQRQAAPEAKDQEEVDTLIETIETTKSKAAYRQAISSLLGWLYTADANAKRAGLDVKAYEFLNSMPVDDAYREAFVEFARITKSSAARDVEEGAKASGRIKARNAKGEYTPVFNLILRAQMLDPLRQKFGFDNLPEDMRLPDEGKPTDLPENKVLEEPKDTDVTEDWDAEDGAFFRDDGQPIRSPVVIGRVRMLVSQFMAKLQVKPRVFVFRNQADLKAKDPELYAQAIAARPQGDFDATSAVGYSFGGRNVIIFSDRVRTEQQLNFVLAHESMGHIGFRALIPQNKFDSLMNQIYNMSPAIRNGVDAAMSARGLPKAEAVEEYLADFAAELDSSIVARIWNAIKNALNKIGVQFGDEAARYFVSLSRKYVRNGDMSSFFRAQDMVKNLQAIEYGLDPNNTGRFAQTQTLRSDSIAAGLMQDNIDGRPMNVDDAMKWFKDRGINLSGGWDNFTGKFFDLLTFRSRRNPGFAQLEAIMSEGRDISMSIRVAMKEKMADVLNRAITLPGTDYSIGGATPEQLDKLNNFLYEAQRYAVSKSDKTKLGNKRLYSVDATGQLVPDQAEIDRIYKMGLITFDQMKNGFSFDISYEEAGKTKTETVKVDGIPGLTEESIEWKGYLAVRETMRDVELKLLKARYLAYTEDRALAYREMAEVMKDGKMTADGRKFLDRMYDKYREIWTDDQVISPDGDLQFNEKSIARANEFLVALNQAILGKETDLNAKVAEFFPKTPVKEISDTIEEFKQELVKGFRDKDEIKFTIQNKLKDIIVAELSNNQADMFTKRTMAIGYTPLLRRGEYEVRISAFNKKGERVVLKQDYKDQLAYRQFENEAEALSIADKMNKELFGDRTYKVEARNKDGEYELMDVKLEAETSAAIDAIAAPPQLNLNEFTRGLRQFSIVLRPDKLQEVIVALTNQNNRARQRLERKFVPGYDPDAIRAVTEHVEARASTISKVMMRPRISELMNLRMQESRNLWYGNKAELDRREKAWKDLESNPAATEPQRNYAKREYDTYAYMYNETNPQGKAKRGNQFYNEASGLLQFMENNRDLNESDFGAGEIASRVRAYTSVMQLGGSIATGALNFVGAITNSIPFLATYNPNTALGGGFGFGPAFAAFQRALSNVGLRRAMTNSRLNTAEYYEEMANDPALLAEYGLEAHEAKFIAREIREGTMIPAQTNALTETARGRSKSGLVQKGMDGFMWTFNATEQASRRAVGLAAYRLEYERRKTSGASEKDAIEAARQFAVEALRISLGEYSVINRPPAWRSGIQSFLYMYKVFPTTSIQLLKALPRSGQLYMLAAMWVLAGVSGFPFAEDLEDIIDTIAQKLGFRVGSIRYEAAKLIDSIAPGASQIILNGGANAVLPADLAGRVSLGDFIPGTGILLAGSNVGRELAEVGGPALSMATDTIDSVATGIKAAATEKVTFEDWLRENPVTLGRMFGDALAYVNSGAVVDRRGYVVSPDMDASVILTRLLGFYPAGAAEEYGVIRVSKRIVDYQKEVSAGFRQAWIKAMIRGDMEQAQAIVDSVNDWNDGAEGTALEINNFQRNARKALQEARRPAGERLLRSAPKSAKEDVDLAATLLGY